MKRFGFLLMPLLAILVGTTLIPKVLYGGTSPITLVLVALALAGVTYALRPRNTATKSTQQVMEDILDDFCRDAFAENDDLGKKYLSAISDIGNNMPKNALSKLEKLEARCATNSQKYAVALATAHCHKRAQDFKKMIRQLNKAIVLNPTADLAYQLGDCHQRLGELDKARDSYEFAMELDPSNPQYPSSIGTTYVGDGRYDMALHYAQDALDIDETFAQALATCAISYGMKRDSEMYSIYLEKAADQGYSRDKIETTVKTLKKRER